MKSKTMRRSLIGAILVVVLCIGALAGVTYAWFSSSASTVNNIASGTVAITATQTSVATIENGDADWTTGTDYTFAGKVTVTPEDGFGVIEASNLVPGDGIRITVTVSNTSTVPVLFRTKLSSKAGIEGNDTLTTYNLFNALSGSIVVAGTAENSTVSNTYNFESLATGATPATTAARNIDTSVVDDTNTSADWISLAAGENVTVTITLLFDYEEFAQNDWQNAGTTITFTIEAIQGNADTSNVTDVMAEETQYER